MGVRQARDLPVVVLFNCRRWFLYMKVSIIVPVLNEAKTITSTLEHLQEYRQQGHEVIVIDGGSHDDTVACTQGLVDNLLQSKSGRAFQMNVGAKCAHGEILLFLHADTLLPRNACDQINEVIEQGNSWGRFNVRLSGGSWLFRVIEKMMNWRSCLMSVATGDQAIFVSKSMFNKVGAYPDIELMEDIVLCSELRKYSKPACLEECVITSSRKWEKNGILRTVMLMWKLRLMHYFGVPANKLAELYYR